MGNFIIGLSLTLLLPIYIHICAKIAARAWFEERKRYQTQFMNDLTRETTIG